MEFIASVIPCAVISTQAQEGTSPIDGTGDCQEDEEGDSGDSASGDLQGLQSQSNLSKKNNPTVRHKHDEQGLESLSTLTSSPILSGNSNNSPIPPEFSLGKSAHHNSTSDSVLSPPETAPAHKRSKPEQYTDDCESINIIEAKGFKCHYFNDCYSVKCPAGHTSFLRSLDSPIICKKCEELLERCRNYAALNGGRLLTQRYVDCLEFECEKKHIWKVKYSNYVFSKWCSHCTKLRKKENLRKLQKDKKKINQQYQQEQDAMLEKARKDLLEEDKKYGNFFMSLEEAALNKARKFIKSSNEPTSRLEEFAFLYWVLLIPPTDLKIRLLTVPKEELPSFYRKNALRLHPDKMKHPASIEAFQKFVDVYKSLQSHIIRYRKMEPSSLVYRYYQRSPSFIVQQYRKSLQGGNRKQPILKQCS